MNEASDLLTVKDVAKKLKVTPQYVRKLITEKKIDATRVGKQWLFEIDNVNNFIKDNNFCIEPDDHERLTDDIPEIVALSFFSCTKKEVQPVRFAIVSDLHAQDIPDGLERMKAVVDAANHENVEFLIQLGEFVRLDSAAIPYRKVWEWAVRMCLR